MNTPPLLILATLVFWGWQTGHLIYGILAGGLLESSRLVKARWSLTQADFNRLSNVCVVLFLGVGAFFAFNEGTVSFNDFFVNAGRRPEAMRQAGRSALYWFQWFPMIFLPLMAAQVFNERSKVGLATFSWWLRRQEARHPNSKLPREEFDITYAYFAMCLLAASAATEQARSFYCGVAALMAWALWPLRTRRYSIVVWSSAFLIVAAAGYSSHVGLIHLQKKLEEMNVQWFSRFSGLGFSDKETRTRMGSIGDLKGSERIALRLRTDGGAPPELLREASYSTYLQKVWNNPTTRRGSGSVFPESDQETWLLQKKKSKRTLSIGQYLRGGDGLLPLPAGSSELNELFAGTVQTNFFGATRVKGAPGLIIYNVRYEEGETIDSAPNVDDLRVDDNSEPSVAQVANDLQLTPNLAPREAMKRVSNLFAEKFQYSSYLSTLHRATTNETELARFLLHTRSGHCEYFASATTLLLRKAGIPTRYAVGFSVQEGKGTKYVVRDKHAHAWVLAYYDGAWHDFDTTPASWSQAEAAANHSFLQPIQDFFSDLWFQFSRFRWSKTEWRKYLIWTPVPLLIVVLLRFFFGKQWKTFRAKRIEKSTALARQGVDSDFYLIEKYFAKRGLPRAESESWPSWLRRITEHESSAARLQRVLVLHQRHRFDPQGLNAEERAELHREVHAWMQKANEVPNPSSR